MLRALVKFLIAPPLILFLYMFNMGLGLSLVIGGEILGARLCIWLLGHEPTGRDMSALFPAGGLAVGAMLAISICGFFMIGFFIPFVLNFLLGTAEDIAPAYKPVAKKVEGYVDSAAKYLDER